MVYAYYYKRKENLYLLRYYGKDKAEVTKLKEDNDEGEIWVLQTFEEHPIPGSIEEHIESEELEPGVYHAAKTTNGNWIMLSPQNEIMGTAPQYGQLKEQFGIGAMTRGAHESYDGTEYDSMYYVNM